MTPEHYRHIVDYYLEPKNEWSRSRVERVMAAAEPRPGERVLDIGCANATFSFHSSRAGARPVGLDRDEAVLRSGREITRRFGGVSTPRVRGDASRLPFRDGAFDLIINADFVEHLTEELKVGVYREMHRVMRPGGRGVVYTPSRTRVQLELLGERVKRLLGLRRSPVPGWKEYVDPDHFGMTDPFTTAALLRSAGFDLEMDYHEFHVPLLSRIPGMNAVLSVFLAPWFSNRFLARIRRRAER